jgi:serine/threonine-protein kinase
VLEPGTIIDRYEVEASLGEGGMATVYRVRHQLLGSLHALKVLRPALVTDDNVRKRFYAEGRIQAQLHHPYIASVTDLVSGDGVAGLVMEYLEGQTLAHRIDVDGPLSPPEAVEIFSAVLHAVEHAHAFGVVHRDLKPSNVFLCSRTRGMARPVVLDFGIAKLRADAAVTTFHAGYTNAGARMGTASYMSPEQVRSAADVDARSDIFALGSVLFEALTGELLFSGDSDFDVMQAVVEGTRKRAHDVLPTRQRALADVIETALAADPADRFADCVSFREAMVAAVQRLPVTPAVSPVAPVAAPPVPPPPAPRVERVTLDEPPPLPEAPPPSDGPALVAMPGTAYAENHPLTSKVVLVDELRGNVIQDRDSLGRRAHARLLFYDGQWWIEPSKRGRVVRVDGDYLRERLSLSGGETVHVGEHVFRFLA